MAREDVRGRSRLLHEGVAGLGVVRARDEDRAAGRQLGRTAHKSTESLRSVSWISQVPSLDHRVTPDGAGLLDEGGGDHVVTVSLGFVVGMLASAETG